MNDKPQTKVELIEFPKCFCVRCSTLRSGFWVLASESYHNLKQEAERIVYNIKHQDGTWTDWLEVDHRAKGIERTINIMQTNAIRFSPVAEFRPSWLYFPSAKFFEATEKGFRLLPQNGWDAILEYEVM